MQVLFLPFHWRPQGGFRGEDLRFSVLLTIAFASFAAFASFVTMGCAADEDPNRQGSLLVPERFELGRPATVHDIAAWDLDVMPDGEGLPLGEGSVDAGRVLYGARCQHCHGADGLGGPFDRLAGRIEGDAFPFATDPKAARTIGSYWPFATTLFDYTRRAMPLERPGSLRDDEVYALTAYLLYLNGLVEADAVLDRTSLPNVLMPARGRFVRDDRVGGGEIR